MPLQGSAEGPEHTAARGGQKALELSSIEGKTLAPPEIRLTGVVRGLGSRAVAIIDGHFIPEGNTYKGSRVVRIGNFSVEMEYQGQHYLIGFTTPQNASAAGGLTGIEQQDDEGQQGQRDEAPTDNKDGSAVPPT